MAAYNKYRKEAIIVDFGTATTFDYVPLRGDIWGGALLRGLSFPAKRFFEKASKLPRVEFSGPNPRLPKIRSALFKAGIMFGYAGLVDGIVNRIRTEVETKPLVIATGGLANIIAPETKTIEKIEEMLTLDGLRFIYELNKK